MNGASCCRNESFAQKTDHFTWDNSWSSGGPNKMIKMAKGAVLKMHTRVILAFLMTRSATWH